MTLSFKQDRASTITVIDMLERNPNLNDWEKGFVNNIRQHVITENKFLSTKQEETLSKLWEKY